MNYKGDDYPKTTFFIVAACFLISGFAGLLYQTVWLRQFGIVFGTAESAVAATLAAYMAGLGVGAYFGGKLANSINRPLMAYVALELGIGASALSVPWLISYIQAVLGHAVTSEWIDYQTLNVNLMFIYTATTFLILMLPTTLMGATLPILLRFVVTADKHIGSRTGLLYGMNTVGAVGGTLITAFLLLPRLELTTIVVIGVMSNCIAAAGAFQLKKQQLTIDTEESFSVIVDKADKVVLAAMCVSGFVSFSLEVTWTRLLGHITGGSIFAFATMLGTFLSGIALGSIAANKLAKSPEVARFYFALCQIGIGVLATTTYLLLGRVVPDDRSWIAMILLSAAVMLPVTLFIGATFPLAVRASAHTPSQVAVAAGRVYALNTVGAIIGALAAGFLLLPSLGFAGTIKVLSSISATVALCVVIKKNNAVLLSAISVAALIGINISPLSRPDAVIGSENIHGASFTGEEVFYAVGRSATVFVQKENGFIDIRTNGLPEASIAVSGSPPVKNSQQWLGALPLLVNPNAKDVMVIGLGGGVALEALPEGPDIHITVVEIESEVLAANRAIEEVRKNPIFDRSDTTIVLNDARSSLSLSNQMFDVIISQPSHPWTAGASHLYTVEFIKLAKQRLRADGVFLQWINAAFLDEALLQSLTATLTSQFQHVVLFQPAPGVLEFLASDENIESALANPSLDKTIELRRSLYSELGIQSPLDVIASLTLLDKGVRKLAGDVVPNSDELNLLATRSKSRGDGLSLKDFTRLTESIDALCNDQSTINRLNPVDQFYIMRQWMLSGFEGRAANCVTKLPRASQVISTAYAMLLQDNKRQAVELLLIAANEDFIHDQGRYLLQKIALGDDRLIDINKIPAIQNDSALAVISAWKSAQQGQWDNVKSLDSRLAKSRSQDIWYQDAAKLMAEWRIREAVAENSRQNLVIAIAIIDSALSSQWTEELLILRTGAAALLRDPNLYVATAHAYLTLIDNRQRTKSKAVDKVKIDKITQSRLTGIKTHLLSDWLSDHKPAERLLYRIQILES